MKQQRDIQGIIFLMLSFCIPFNLYSQNLLVESLTGPITQNEINAFKAYIKSTTRTPLPVDNVGNALAYGTAGQNTRAMGLMYEITGDTAILNRMILFSDYILACRNDNVNGKHDIVSTGKIEPVWPNYNDNPAPVNNQGWIIGAEQGDILEHFAYCAELILKNPVLWNRTVPVGDKFGNGATYLQRAQKYIDEANYTIDQVIYPHNVNPTTNLLVWFDKTNILPWNQQMMLLGGFFRVARCLEILGTDQARLTRYNAIISYNCIRFTNHLNQFKYTQNGKDYFVWAYVEQNPLRYIEDNTEHSTYDVYGMHRNYRSGKYGVTKDIMVNFGNTMKDIIMLPDGTYAMNVDGSDRSGAPRGSLRPDWVIASGFRTDLYEPYARSQMSNGGTRPGSPRSASNILWVKYMNYHKLWDNFEYNTLTIPGKIEAENYNLGGEGISYHDLTAGNTLNTFRMDGVDVQSTTDAGGGYNIGAVQAGEWLDYTVNVTTAGRYLVQARVSATTAGKTFHIEMDGQNISGAIVVPNTGNYQTFQTVSVTINQPLTVGQKKMRVVMDSPSFNLNHITFVLNQAPTVSITAPVNGSSVTSGTSLTINASASDPDGFVSKTEFYIDGVKIGEDASSPFSISWTSTAGTHWIKAIATDNLGMTSKGDSVSIVVRGAYGGTVWTIPGKIEAENYDIGGQGITFNDLTPGNTGNVYRTDDVDINSSSDAGGGYHIYYVQAGDWMEYTVNVTTAGTYILQVRVAATATGKTFHIEMDGQNISGAIPVPNTGNYQTFQTVSITIPSLAVGKKVMRIVMDSANFNLNYVVFTLNQVPTVSITSPVTGTTFTSGNSITINASAADADGSVSKVEFFIDGTKVGEDLTAPYSFNWTATTGIHSLIATATDNSGAKKTSAAISITVDNPNQLPVVSITSPSSGAIVTVGSDITINANATDTDGNITKVEFFAGITKIGEDLTTPYSITWTPSVGNYILTVKATDNQGAVKTSAEVTVTIDTPPTVSISSPANNTLVTEGDNVTITAIATDADGSIDKVEFFLDGTKIGEDISSPYSISWTAIAGTHSLTVRATDDLGITGTSAVITFKVNKTPSIVISSPLEGEGFTEENIVNINVNAEDADGSIASVVFYVNGTSIGTDIAAPYSISLNAAVAGTYLLTAQATDNEGAKTTSSPVSILVNANQAPDVTIISPADGAVYSTGVAVSIDASALDYDGSVAKVEFYVDGIKISEDMSSPFNSSWTTVLGIHSVKAVAFDNLGVSSSYEIDLNVIQPNQSPQVTLTSPSNNLTVTAGEIVPIQVSASDADGSIVNVSVYVDNVKVGELTASPYNFTWIAAEGTHVIEIIATDDEGGTTNSAPVTVIVNPLSTQLSYGSDAASLLLYPNPAASEITIKISSKLSGNTSLILLDALGKEVAVLANGTANSGIVNLNLDSLKLSSGLYMIQLINDKKTSIISFIKE